MILTLLDSLYNTQSKATILQQSFRNNEEEEVLGRDGRRKWTTGMSTHTAFFMFGTYTVQCLFPIIQCWNDWFNHCWHTLQSWTTQEFLAPSPCTNYPITTSEICTYNINFNFCAEDVCTKREILMLALTINFSDICPKADWLISGGDGCSLSNQENFTQQNLLLPKLQLYTSAKFSSGYLKVLHTCH